MAYRVAGRWDVGQVRLRDGNSEVRRGETVHQKVVRRDELEIFGLEEEHPRVAVFRNLSPNLFLKPTLDFQMAQQRQDVVLQERQAGRVRKDEVELLDAAQMEQLQILPGPQEQPPRELRQVSQQRALEQMDEQVDEHSSLTQARVRKAFQQDASPDFPGSHWVPRASPLAAGAALAGRRRRLCDGWRGRGRSRRTSGRFLRRSRLCLLLRFGRSFLRRQALEMLSRELRMFEVERARVRLLFRDADFRQEIDQDFRFDLELARQLVNSNLIGICHQPLFSPKLVRTRRFLRFTF